MPAMSGEDHKQALPPGFRLGSYRVVRVLGVGGFGVTYLCEHASLGHWVAVKEYLPNEFAVREGATVHPKSAVGREDFEWGLARFVDEARTLTRFRHPNLVRVSDYFEANNTAYIVMDYEDGKPLDVLLKRHGTLTEAQLKRVLLPVADGLRQVHAAGFLHRDIKPSNIFVRRSDESPVLLDFGSARQALGRKSRSMTAIASAGYSLLVLASRRSCWPARLSRQLALGCISPWSTGRSLWPGIVSGIAKSAQRWSLCLIGCRARLNGNTWRVRGRGWRVGGAKGDPASVPMRTERTRARVWILGLVAAMAIRARRRLGASARMHGVCRMCWAMHRNGRRIVGVGVTRLRRVAALHESMGIATSMFYVAVPGATDRSSSAPRIATGVAPVTPPQHRLPRGLDAHPMSLNLLTSGVRWLVPGGVPRSKAPCSLAGSTALDIGLAVPEIDGPHACAEPTRTPRWTPALQRRSCSRQFEYGSSWPYSTPVLRQRLELPPDLRIVSNAMQPSPSIFPQRGREILARRHQRLALASSPPMCVPMSVGNSILDRLTPCWDSKACCKTISQKRRC